MQHGAPVSWSELWKRLAWSLTRSCLCCWPAERRAYHRQDAATARATIDAGSLHGACRRPLGDAQA
eukprot:3306100-Pleurochrysis_carterae.AAC.1